MAVNTIERAKQINTNDLTEASCLSYWSIWSWTTAIIENKIKLAIMAIKAVRAASFTSKIVVRLIYLA